MSKKYELTPVGILAIETRTSVEDARRTLQNIQSYASTIKKNSIIFKKNGDIIFVQVRKTK